MRMNRMSSLSFIRGLVRQVMEADADDEEHRKSELKIPKVIKPIKFPNSPDEDLRKSKAKMARILRTRKYPDEDYDDPD